MQALIIIGHGSHLNADSSAPVYRHAEAIRATGAFDEVRECFWKEEPSMREVFDLVESPDVYVVPLFISEGYFIEEVIPRELGLSGPAPSVTRKLGKTIRYTGPVGTHPSMADMILRRAEETAGLTAGPGSSSSDTAPSATATRPRSSTASPARPRRRGCSAR